MPQESARIPQESCERHTSTLPFNISSLLAPATHLDSKYSTQHSATVSEVTTAVGKLDDDKKQFYKSSD